MYEEEGQAHHSVPRRPDYGFAAWQVTLGYMCANHSPDAMLKLQVQPAHDEYVHWAATVSWGKFSESVYDCRSIGEVFESLWRAVRSRHTIFLTRDDALRSPSGYDQEMWLDIQTLDVLHRLLWTTQMAFGDDWQLIIVYQPTEVPVTRVQVRLIADKNRVSIGSRGASLIEALRALFRNATPAFSAHVGEGDSTV